MILISGGVGGLGNYQYYLGLGQTRSFLTTLEGGLDATFEGGPTLLTEVGHSVNMTGPRHHDAVVPRGSPAWRGDPP